MVDATDVKACAATLAAAIDRVRATPRPLLIEARTLRLRGHAAYDTGDYLKPGEEQGFFARDPLPKVRAELASSPVGAARIQAIENEITAFIDDCVSIAVATPRPDPAGMEGDLFAPPGRQLPRFPSLDSAPAEIEHRFGRKLQPTADRRRSIGPWPGRHQPC